MLPELNRCIITKAHILTTSGLQNIIRSQQGDSRLHEPLFIRSLWPTMMRLPCANAIHMVSPLDLVAPVPSRPRPHWSYERQAHCVSEKVPTCDRLRLPGAKPSGCNPQVTGNGKEAARMQVFITPGSAIKCWYLKKSGHQPI